MEWSAASLSRRTLALFLSSTLSLATSYGAGINLADGIYQNSQDIVYDADGNDLAATVDLTGENIKVAGSYAIQFANESNINELIATADGSIELNIKNDNDLLGIIRVTCDDNASAIDFNFLSGTESHPLCIVLENSTGGYEISATTESGNSAAFGSGLAYSIYDNSFSNWDFGNFGGCTVSANGDHAAAFGSGFAYSIDDNSFSNWNFGNFAEGNAIYSIAIGGGGQALAAAFGVAFIYASCENSLKNWTAEFTGNQTITALAYGNPASLAGANCLGGWANDDMRFYFNGLNCESTATINVAGVKFSGLAFQGDSQSEHVVLSIWDAQGNGEGWGEDEVAVDGSPQKFGWAKAVALGDGFQLNVGRTRDMADGKETDSSRAGGGKTAGGEPGTLNLVGAVSRTPYAVKNNLGEPKNTILRIDGGWTVNCFSPVRDLRTIDLIYGRLVLMNANQDSVDNLQIFAAAVDDLGRGIVIHGESGFYRGTEDESALYPSRAGYVELAYGTYPVKGSLTVSAQDTLKFH
ncbi:MAG: hypothetical protein LBB38_02945, partial [Puniceicoccales bacterium]|nr:hypothetical protein [Puniceicoccales bacterium]